VAIGSLKLRPKAELIIALDDLDFSWRKEEVERVIELWNANASIAEIADQTRPPVHSLRTKQDAEDEVALLIMHLRRQGQIQLRPGGVFGKREVYDEAI
jgi:hypothetical protein